MTKSDRVDEVDEVDEVFFNFIKMYIYVYVYIVLYIICSHAKIYKVRKYFVHFVYFVYPQGNRIRSEKPKLVPVTKFIAKNFCMY
jgi:hypothetical protein